LSATSTTANVTNCMSTTGVYLNGSNCLMMEAY
jgi:type IV pilus assembly protein PilV